MYKVNLIDEAKLDIKKLPKKLVTEATSYFKKYQNDPYKYSQELQNLNGLNLQGYRKTYLANATYRIIFKIEENKIKIVEVVAVGKRKDKQVYKDAYSRIK